MARSKVKDNLFTFATSLAFAERSKQEMLNLKKSVAQSLKEDIKSLLDDDSHSDLLITNGTDVVYAHKCIMKSRLKQFWQEGWLTKTMNEAGIEIESIEIIGLTGKQLEEFIRQVSVKCMLRDLYLINEPPLLIEEYLHCFPGGRRSSLSGDTDVQQLVLSNHVERLVGDQSEQTNRPDAAENASTIDGNSLLAADVQYTLGCEASTKTDSEFDRFDRSASLQDNYSRSAFTEHLRVDHCDITDHEAVCHNESTDFKCHQMLITEFGPSAEHLNGQLKAKIAVDDNNKRSIVHELQKIIVESNISDVVKKSYFGITGDASNNMITDVDRDLSTISADIMDNSETFSVAFKNSVIPDEGETLVDDVKKASSSLNSKLKTCSVSQEELVPSSPVSCKMSEKTLDPIPSNAGKADFDSVPYETCSPLGKDLLQLYLNELDCDCCLAVDGIRFMVHKCLLSARSEYFHAMLCGQWCESKMETINLEGVMPQAVEQLLLFLYGGVLELTTPCDLTDLFIVADMYGIVSLKNVLAFYVKKDLCHFFHRPCFVCTGKAAEALSLCYHFNLPDLQGRVVKWVAKYFTKIWPTKSFASLPDGVHDLSLEGIKSQMTIRNVLDIIMECDKLTTSLPRIKWTESVLCLLTQLMDTSIEFTSTHFIEVISTPEFQQWAKVASWKAGALEEIFNTVIDSLPINMSCRIYETLINLESVLSDEHNADLDVVGLLQAMIKRCEKFFKSHINQIMRTNEWFLFPKHLQSKILDSSAYLFLDVSKIKTKPKGFSFSKPPQKFSLRSGSGTHSANKLGISGQLVIQLRSRQAAQQRERPKSSVTTSEQAKKLTKSEKIPVANNMFQPKSRNTIADFSPAASSAAEPNSDLLSRNLNVSKADKKIISQPSIPTESSPNELNDNAEASVSEQQSESQQCKKVASDVPGSASSSTKLLPSRIPLLTRSPKAGRPKSMLNLHDVSANSLDSQNSNCNATPQDNINISFAGKDEQVTSHAYDTLHASNLFQQDGFVADLNSKPDMLNSVTLLDRTEPDVSTLPAISSTLESGLNLEASSREEKPKVNVVAMSKTLNIGFTLPDE
ncbi:hypothetical protein Btru_016071 [Bulinus truncatus]|nr:hypothetical protein Btru_016071 [Bulinus truncatus]